MCYRSEYGAFWKCVQAGGVYALTQLGKMLLLATFFPTSGDYLQDDPDNFSPVGTAFLSFKKIYIITTFHIIFIAPGIAKVHS